MYRVVIIDDEHYLRKSLIQSEVWEKNGFKICAEAECGLSGYDIIKEYMPHLAVIDITMPNLDGLSLIKKLRNENNDLKIILLSGHSEFEYAQRAIRYNVLSYLLKPLDDEELVAELKTIKNELDTEYENIKIQGKLGKTIFEIKKYIDDNYMKTTLSIEEVCDHVHFNYHYICKLFKDQTNDSLGKYIVAVRMKNAKEFINKGEANLEILASKVGYNDTLYFTKCFKKFYGFTPSQYIRGHEGEESGRAN